MTGGSASARRRRRWVQESAEPIQEGLERACPALVQRMRRVPLDRERQDDVVGIELGAVVEAHAVAEGARPNDLPALGLARLGECRAERRLRGIEAVQRLGDLGTDAE